MKKTSRFIFFLFVAVVSLMFVGMKPNTVSATTTNNEEFMLKGCKSAYLTEYATGKELYSYKPDEKREIASMVKIMTANIIFDEIRKGNLSMDEMITISPTSAGMGGSQMFLDAGAQYSVKDLLKGIIVVSANDASVAMAERIAGSQEEFVSLMNSKAVEMGMNNTKFAHATGLPSQEEQYSSARDVNIMTRKLMSNPEYFQFAQIWLEDYTHPSGRVTQLANTNKLIRYYQGCIGGKTGFTNNAGFCLSACAQRNGLKVVATVLGGESSKERFAGVSKLFDYSFAKYEDKVLIEKNQEIENNIKVKSGASNVIKVAPIENLSMVVPRGGKVNEIVYELPQSVKAPISKGDIIGRVGVDIEGEMHYIDVVAMEDIKKASFADWIKNITSKW